MPTAPRDDLQVSEATSILFNTMRVWFNKNFSSLAAALRQSKQYPSSNQRLIIVTHTDRMSPNLQEGQIASIEPSGVVGPAYVDWALEFCNKRNIDVFFPGKEALAIATASKSFLDCGVHVVTAAQPADLAILDDKSLYLPEIEAAGISVPRFETATDSSTFSAAVDKLRTEGHRVCFKPARGVNASGFHLLDDDLTESDRMLRGVSYRISTKWASEALAEVRQCPQLLVMQYLEGNEFSVDCLAKNGNLILAIAREKTEGCRHSQLLREMPELDRPLRILTLRFGLNGVFNIQFREHNGRLMVLDVNARISGGLAFSMLSGIDFLGIAARLAKDVPVDTTELIPKGLPCWVAMRVDAIRTGLVDEPQC